MAKPESKEEIGELSPPPPTPPLPPVKKHVFDPAVSPKRAPMARTGSGKNGRRIDIVANHFKVSVNVLDVVFYQYTVSIKSGDDQAIDGKGIGRKVMEKLYQTYSSEMAGKEFAYDGEKALYTIGPLPLKKFEFIVVLEEASVKRNTSPGITESPGKRTKRSFQSKTFNVEISFATTIPMKPIALALKGIEAKNSTGDALRVIDIILRHQAAKRGCLLVRQSFFHDDVRNFVDVGGGVTACRGFHSSFRTTQGGLSLNMEPQIPGGGGDLPEQPGNQGQ